MRKIISAVAVSLALCATTTAQAADTASCITQQEMDGIITYFLPKVFDQVAQKCSSVLPADSYVRTSLPSLATQFENRKIAAWPMAKSAFLKLGQSEGKEIAGVSDDVLRPLIDEALSARMSIPIKPSTCGDVNDIMEALSPLSPEQTVHLASAIITVATRDGKAILPCPRRAD
ncbi:hypothetical protein EDF56_10748 [Novosphingobium sp. PhB165]|uniref:hypothetical protein n=1 Tax=Novosphingobium sp. PhB165 TaxID=2485105 RepID=UPI001049214C|nr:hypothetical protein [Novosphingobium sp. PhB165]TCM16469.1 hypothetical protein EDF56_10748 [Novosphingobium sp. PhB165]